jgi:enoyl-CoA hydratase
VPADPVSYKRNGEIAVVTIDDGKANALSPSVLAALHAAMDRAETERVRALLLTGRPGTLSGGFDLSVMRGGDLAAIGGLVTDGGELLLRIYRSPMPIVCAASGHAIAAGALTLLASHFRVGAEGPFRIALTETAIGMVLPDWAIVLAGERLTPRHAQQAAVEARVYDPHGAVEAGFLDRVVAADRLMDAAMEESTRLAAFAPDAYAGNAAKMRGPGVAALEAAVGRDRDAVRGLAEGLEPL